MSRLERSEKGKIINVTIFWCVVAAALWYAGLIIHGAVSMKGLSLSDKTVTLGPLDLYGLSKIPRVGGGYFVTMRVLSGTFVYLLLWLGIAITASAWRLRKLQRKSR